MAATASSTGDSTKFLLLGSKSVTETVQWPVLLIFSQFISFIKYVSESANSTDSHVLIVPGINIKEVVDDPSYHFDQVRLIYVYYDNDDDRKRDENHIKDEHKKLRFRLRQNLPILIQKLKAGNAIDLPESDYQETVNDVAMLLEQRVSTKRSSPTDRHTPTPKRVASRSKHGLSVRNIEQVDPHYTCPSCRFLFVDPHQLECGHRICQCCIKTENVQTSCLTCSQTSLNSNIRFDRGFRNDMLPLPVSCSRCDWAGLYEAYQEHTDQKHLDGENTNAIVDVYTQRTSQSRFTGPVHTTETSQRIIPDIVSTSRSIDMPNHNDLINNQYHFLLNHFQEVLRALSNRVNMISNNQQRLDSELRHSQASLQMVNQNFFSIKTMLDDINSRISGFQLIQDLHAQQSWSLQRDIHDALSTSYDGTYIWKITNVREKMADARSERQPSMYSPPFYSSRTGYKMCLRLYLNGDSDVRGRYLSLFIVIMRGEHDAILQWPFPYKVIFRLIDQSTPNDHSGDIVQSVSPDIQSDCFKRPGYNMNFANGIKNFLPVLQFKQHQNRYVEDNTMFIDTKIDFLNEYASVSSLPGELPNDAEHVGVVSENFVHIT